MSKRKFNVGDVCRIRQWDDMVEEYGTDADGDIRCEFTFTSHMKHMCGETFTIKETSYTGSCYISEEGIEGACAISADMLEPIEDESTTSPITAEDFNAILNL